MYSKHPLRIVNYAVNGLGLGHLTRLTAVSRQLRRIATTAGVPTEITFLTSSESDALCYLHGFASFKIPSKNSVAHTRIAPQRYRKMAKQWIWNAVNVLSPDILIVDTFPSGSFNELYDILDFGQKNVFMYRAVKAEIAAQSTFQSVLRRYHSIIVPSENNAATPPLPEECRDRLHKVGEILIRSNTEILDRHTARQQLDIPVDATVVYCTIGGGGDTRADELLQVFRQLAQLHPAYVFVIGAGPLYRGTELHAPNIRWTQRLLMMDYYMAFDCALTAGGFNSVNELLHCGIPCLFLPQQRRYDDQFLRVEQHTSKGAGIVADSLAPEILSAQLEEVLARRSEMSKNAQQSVAHNCARDAAREILSTVLSPLLLDESLELLQHAQLESLRLSIADELLYCEILALLGKIAMNNNTLENLQLAEDRAQISQDLMDFALQNNRTLRDVRGALRSFMRGDGTVRALLSPVKEHIIQLTHDIEAPTEFL